ncbi:hypothetical protein KSC_027630 [Ktedonobacter sp. SOSP1-52]|uniref:hypothetical protein n=1 Tax=Ktedonobacter sp. SOSP1-52 TaxID=2778366 RepID=UPI001915574D|nr:hypothetical protein [Ktedonobacter sp. SOSP1-52]GHO63871.1 hypothetical protein KSC_027630 [Ktedonobacter sp. SOSP1-52]
MNNNPNEYPQQPNEGQPQYQQPTQPYQQPTNYPQPGMMPPPYPQQPTKKPMGKMGKFGIGCLVLVGVLIVCGVISTLTRGTPTQSNPNQTQTQTQATQEPTKPATQAPTPKPYPHFGDGTFEVGKDIQPGTYRTREASSGCYFARLKGFGGAVGDIIANGNTDAPTVITIARTDKGFNPQTAAPGLRTYRQSQPVRLPSMTVYIS